MIEGEEVEFLEIVHQPQQRGMRFRYACEGKAAGSILAENSDMDRKSWPSCVIKNYFGPALMRVSLVTKDDPPQPHPHSLVGKGCKNGFCMTAVDESTKMLGVFPNLGIQCVRRREIQSSIIGRLNNQVNPFNTDHLQLSSEVDLNVVRLCFEVFLLDDDGNCKKKLKPVVSQSIYDKKATSSSILKICRIDKIHSSCWGSETVFLLCDKVQKEDIEIVFSDKGWEAYGEFNYFDVHRQVAIVFTTPPYKDVNIMRPVEVTLFLRRPSDQEKSQEIEFFYLPRQHAELLERRKRRNILNADIKNS